MKTVLRLFTLFLMLTAMAFQFSGCEDEGKEDPKPTEGDNIVLTNNSTHGEILTDADGMTLYFFTRDVSGESQCEDGCLGNWPVFYVEDIDPGDNLNTSDFENITREDGEQQTTYKGWPLYYFSGDSEAGQTNGDGVNDVWFVSKPDYSIMLADAQLVGADGKNYTSDYQEGEGETQYFVDAEGRTLYAFGNDTKNQNNYTAEDFSNNDTWPIFYAEINSLPSGLNASDFGTIDVFGEMQLTYKGWPLYYFIGDENRGDNKGVSVPTPGKWPIVNKNTEMAPEAPTVLMAEDEEFGNILTDAEGRTLYFFANDVKGTNNCSGGCPDFWPIFNAGEVILEEGSNLNPDDFGTIGEGENEQTTYKGWPLYYYSPTGDGVPEAEGETAGDGLNNVWFIAKPDYSLMVANAQLVGHDGENYTSNYEVGEEKTMYFTDAEGRTLYIFTNDTKDTNNFTNEDFGNNGIWPIFHVDIEHLPSIMNAAEFGVIDVFGESQLTYKGWPLYYFGQDENRGDNKGISFPSPGVWPIVNNSTEAAE